MSTLNHTKYLSEDETAELEKTCLKYLEQDTRNCLLILTALYTGARAMELTTITRADLDSKSQSVLIRGLKGSNDREVPLPAWLFAELQGVKTERFFDLSYTRIRAIWCQFRPVEKKFHALRHTFAIRQLRKHGQIDVIKRLLGHRSIQNTMVYLDYQRSQDELRRLVV